MQKLNINRTKLLRICECYYTCMEDGKEWDNKLMHSIRPWKGLKTTMSVVSNENIKRKRERNGEQENKIKRRAF